ncbi:MAG: type I methionyl aminopeptidase [Bacillota bacterium]
MIILKSAEELRLMRESGRHCARIMQAIVARVRPGCTTGELNRVAEEEIAKAGLTASFKGYGGFPESICTSVDDEVVHGIPGPRRLEAGQIVSIDLGIIYRGFHSDMAVTVPVGEVEPEKRKLIEVTEESLCAGVAQATVGNRLSDISHAVQVHAERAGFSVVREYVGHGIGRQMHEGPQVPNFGPPGSGPILQEGMTLAIEPMVNLGRYQVYTDLDGWTVRTKDGTASAHFEHTVAVTAEGPQILTLPG